MPRRVWTARESALRVARVALVNQKPNAENTTGSALLFAPDHPAAKQFAASCETFCRLFPNRFYLRRRDPRPLGRLPPDRGLLPGRSAPCTTSGVLSEEEKLHGSIELWNELDFSTNILDKMLHGFVFFEREERGFLKHPDFNSIREEDPALGKDENLRRFEQIYLKRSNVTATGTELENHPIHAFFEDIRRGLKRRAAGALKV